MDYDEILEVSSFFALLNKAGCDNRHESPDDSHAMLF